jgi:NAD(P)H dehydrogenase (quinone)
MIQLIMKKILVIIGHPYASSLNHALAERYVAGARSAGHEVQVLALDQLQFDPILRAGYAQQQVLEPDLVQAQAAILAAEHLVFFYPSWWGTMPALLKGFIDRVFLPGFAFKYKKDSPWWDRLLAGRTGHLVVTMDTPWWYNWLLYGNANIRAMKVATLQFCGVKKVSTTVFDQVRQSTPEKRQQWLEKVYALGQAVK